MKIKLNNFQILFLGMYIFFNTYALFYILNKQETFGDYFEPINNNNIVFLAYFLTVVFFVFFLYPYFQNRIEKYILEVRDSSLENKMAIFVFLLQVSFMLFNLFTGVNSAGSAIKTESAIKYIFIVFFPDMFFVILYGYTRDNKFFKINLIIYLISSIQRGWMGGIFFIAIMELYIYYKNYGFSKKTLLIVSFIVGLLVLLLPYIVMMKWAARVYFGGLSNDFNNELQLVLSLGNISYLDSLNESLSYLYGRFQVLSNVYLFLEHLDKLQLARENDEYIFVFAVGLSQMFLYKVFGFDYTMLTSYYISVIDTKVILDELTSNTHVSYIGWVLVEPSMILAYIFYTILLCYLSVWLNARIGGKYIHFVTWYSLIVFLMHGWIYTYINYLIALFMFYCIKIVIKKIKYKENRIDKCAE